MVAFQKNSKTTNVVDVFVCDKNSRKGMRVDSAIFKRRCNCAAAYAKIDKDSFPGSADEARIAGTAAGYGKEFCKN